jgi:hypothetical protein
VRFASNQRRETTLRLLAECFEELGCIERARCDGATRLEPHTQEAMTAAQALYIELGFVAIGRDVHRPSRTELQL